MALYELIDRPDLHAPVLVLALEGWIDAGLAAASAAEVPLEALDTVTVARFDTDELLDYRARRPTVHMVDGVQKGLTWPSLELQAAADLDGKEMLLLVGTEPDRAWHGFVDSVVDLALDRKSTRLNSSHVKISYAVFCLKKKKIDQDYALSWRGREGLGLI